MHPVISKEEVINIDPVHNIQEVLSMEEVVSKVEVPELIASKFLELIDGPSNVSPVDSYPMNPLPGLPTNVVPHINIPGEGITGIEEIKNKIEVLDRQLVEKMDEIREIQQVISKLEVKEIEEVEKIEETCSPLHPG